MSKNIFVYGDWEALECPLLIGVLNVDFLKNKEIFSFEYDSEWLKNYNYSFFDPDLQMYKGRQFTQQGKEMFGFFTDSCPDRWGRLLMTRREALQAREENRSPKKLMESDFLLGVQDLSRMGALRFKSEAEGPFLAENKKAIPIWTSLRELEQASYLLEKDDISFSEEKKKLELLFQPGSSLGGARPKATVQSPDGSLWIAKFPSRHDEFDSGAWEMVTHELAVLCGLNIPDAKCEKFSKNGSTYLSKRFDRISENRRIHFVSAMTALGKIDGSNAQDGTTYLDIVQCIQQQGAKPTEDLNELWKRIVFSITVTNTDDHLRNHGFLFDKNGLRLSPMYDVNPNPDGTGLSLNIDETDNSLDFDVAIEAAKYFDLKKDDAAKIVSETKNNVKQWNKIAEKYGISRSNILRMSNCFKCD